MRCVLAGSRYFGATVLDALRREEGVEFVCVIVPAKDDRLALAAHAAGLPVHVLANPKIVPGNAIPDGTDLIVAAHTHARVSPEALARSRLGGVGYHPSLLPRHRGRNPYFWSIDSGDELTGVTVHRLAAEYDTGPMLGARSLRVGKRDAWQLARALDRPSLSLLRETVARLGRREAVAEVPQDERLATSAPEPSGDALKVDFGWTTERVLRRIRALSPTPGLALEVEGTPLFVTRAEPATDYVAALIPGEAHISGALTLRTSDGAIQVTRAFFPETEAEATSAEDVAALLKRGPRA